MNTILLLSFLVAATSAATIDLVKDNKTCIFASVDATFHIPYMKDDNTTGIANVTLDGVSNITGHCSNGPKPAMLEATFKGSNRYMMELEQTPMGPSHLTRITLFFVYQKAYFPNLHKDLTDKNETVGLHALIQTWPNTTLLKCNRSETYQLKSLKTELAVTMTTFNFSLQAFNIKNNKPSTEETACGTAITTFAPSTTHHTTHTTTNHTNITTHATTHTTSNVTTVPMPTTTTTTPVPASPSSGTWNVSNMDGDNQTRVCMLMQMALRMVVTYEDKKNKSQSVTVDLPMNATMDKKSMCNATYAVLALHLPYQWVLELYVDSAAADKKQLVNGLKLYYNTSRPPFVDAAHPGMMLANSSTLDLFKSSKNNYYQCDSESDQTVMDVKFEFSDVKMQAGQNHTDTGFTGTDEECAADEKTNAIVPIAVGAALAGLVLIVVIAYLIGRRRRQSGYQSV